MKFKVLGHFQFLFHTLVFVYHKLSLVTNNLLLQTLEEAIDINNSVPQGLSSSIFTSSPEVIFKWIGLVILSDDAFL